MPTLFQVKTVKVYTEFTFDNKVENKDEIEKKKKYYEMKLMENPNQSHYCMLDWCFICQFLD